MARAGRTLARLGAGLFLLAAAPAGAQERPWREPNPCAGRMPAPDYSRCLSEAAALSEREVTGRLRAAMAVVEGRTDLAAVQRNRWKGQLDEAQSRFLLFRNLDCQSVAPFEGPRASAISSSGRSASLRTMPAAPAISRPAIPSPSCRPCWPRRWRRWRARVSTPQPGPTRRRPGSTDADTSPTFRPALRRAAAWPKGACVRMRKRTWPRWFRWVR